MVQKVNVQGLNLTRTDTSAASWVALFCLDNVTNMAFRVLTLQLIPEANISIDSAVVTLFPTPSTVAVDAIQRWFRGDRGGAQGRRISTCGKQATSYLHQRFLIPSA